MNIDYISGFFDADGSIVLSKNYSKNPYKYPGISLFNTRLEILLEVQKFLKEQYSINSYISSKTCVKKNHHVCYQLSFKYRNAMELSFLLKSFHPVKQHRINVLLKYYKKVTPRNGKYNTVRHNKKLAFERLFLWPISYI